MIGEFTAYCTINIMQFEWHALEEGMPNTLGGGVEHFCPPQASLALYTTLPFPVFAMYSGNERKIKTI